MACEEKNAHIIKNCGKAGQDKWNFILIKTGY